MEHLNIISIPENASVDFETILSLVSRSRSICEVRGRGIAPGEASNESYSRVLGWRGRNENDGNDCA